MRFFAFVGVQFRQQRDGRNGVSSFDFTPGDLKCSRSTAGYFHLGDITLRLRTGTSGSWQNVTTSASRTAVTAQTALGDVLAAADLSPALPANLPIDFLGGLGAGQV